MVGDLKDLAKPETLNACWVCLWVWAWWQSEGGGEGSGALLPARPPGRLGEHEGLCMYIALQGTK